MDAKEAKRISQIKTDLIKKFRKIEKEERILQQNDEDDENVEEPIKKQKLTVEKARNLSKLREKLQDEFITQRKRDDEDIQLREKQYEPITKAIKEIKKPSEKTTDLVPLRFAASTPRAIQFEDEEDLTPIPEESFEEESIIVNKSAKALVDSNVIKFGPFASLNLPLANDKQFGIYFVQQPVTSNSISMKSVPKIGSIPIKFDFDDIILTNTGVRYKGTSGLWKLLTRNEFIDDGLYTNDDWENYKEILINTHSIYQNNNPKTGNPKSSKGIKWKQMISKIWDELKNKKGSGLAKYTNNPIEYKYVDNLNKLFERLAYIEAQETAGNNNFHNEKLAFVKFLNDILEDLVKSPNFTKVMIRCLSVLPERMIKGSGIVNDIINNLPFELHWPGYQALGPGTKLKERLARGETGINPLDAAAFEHDKWYRDHKDVESRHVADKVLQKKAWERVISDDAEILDEKLPALVTTGTMWLKRKLGLGLSGSSLAYA